MLNAEIQEKIDCIYIEYINELKPLIAFVEHNYRKFPKGVLKEFRDVFDHVARLYLKNQPDGSAEDNIRKAHNHFCRLKLDIYKYLCDYRKKENKRWLNKYSKYDLTIIDNGEFWNNINERFDRCEETFFKGRSVEHSDVDQACRYYEDYIDECEEILEYIRTKQNLISKAVFKQRRSKAKNIIIGFVLGIIGSLIASVIYSHIVSFDNTKRNIQSQSLPPITDIVIHNTAKN